MTPFSFIGITATSPGNIKFLNSCPFFCCRVERNHFDQAIDYIFSCVYAPNKYIIDYLNMIIVNTQEILFAVLSFAVL
jgi:hypothetical protein